jgi:hypothetical protein
MRQFTLKISAIPSLGYRFHPDEMKKLKEVDEWAAHECFMAFRPMRKFLGVGRSESMLVKHTYTQMPKMMLRLERVKPKTYIMYVTLNE